MTNLNRTQGRTALFPAALAACLVLQGCATIHREPFTELEQSQAVIAGIPDARFWADSPDATRQMISTFRDEQGGKTMLAISGGSDNGAYGAGLLNGWTLAGNRPEFSIVTGVSTGALIAPFAFLGPDQDATLARLYTTTSAEDIYRLRFPLAILGSPSAASTRPFERLIASTLTDALIDRIAYENARGRRLFISTANLDSQRMVIWNMGAIASSSAPGRYTLFRQILLASSSIPALFPPVMIEAELGGRTISEMHVDGGTSAQILTLADEILTGDAAPSGSNPRHIYIIVNNKLNGAFHLVTPTTLPIATQAFSLNLRSSLSNSIDLNYLSARERGIDFNISYIDKDYPGEDRAPFDMAYMQGLFENGLRLAESGEFWDKRPPGWDD